MSMRIELEKILKNYDMLNDNNIIDKKTFVIFMFI